MGADLTRVRRAQHWLLRVLATCAVLASTAAPGAAVALTAPTLAIASVSDSTRSVTFESAYAAGTAEVALFVDGHETTASPVSPSVSGVVHIVATLPGDCTVEAVARSAGGSDVATSAPLSVVASAFAPQAPVLRVTVNQLVRPSYAFTLLTKGRTTRASLTIDGVGKWAGNVSANATVTLPAVTVPYGRHTASVTAKNAWGARTASVPVYQLGWSMPTMYRYVLIDKSDFCLYYVTGRRVVSRYLVGIGMPYMPTPTGTFLLGAPERSPSAVWGVTRMVLRRKIGGYWYRTGIFLHGTNDPGSIGTMSSHGCIRMYNRDVLRLASQLKPYSRPFTFIRN